MAPDCQVDPRERKLVLLLKEERLRQGISATRLAARVGLSRSGLLHIEQNRCCPTLSALLKISDGLGMSLPKVMMSADL